MSERQIWTADEARKIVIPIDDYTDLELVKCRKCLAWVDATDLGLRLHWHRIRQMELSDARSSR